MKLKFFLVRVNYNVPHIHVYHFPEIKAFAVKNKVFFIFQVMDADQTGDADYIGELELDVFFVCLVCHR